MGTFILSFLLMTYNYLWITASDKMPVGLVNLLFQTSIAFTYVLSACVGLEGVTGRGVARAPRNPLEHSPGGAEVSKTGS